jgi:hypothetical protein
VYTIALIVLIVGLVIELFPEKYFKKLNNGVTGGIMMLIAIDIMIYQVICDLSNM